MKLALAAILVVASPLVTLAQSNIKCAGMAQFRSPGMTLEITRAVEFPNGRAPGWNRMSMRRPRQRTRIPRLASETPTLGPISTRSLPMEESSSSIMA
jgi:hypothetical protein